MKEEPESRLYSAVKSGIYKKVKNLLQSGYDVSALSSQETIKTIFYAIQCQRYDLVSLIVQYGAKFKNEDIGESEKSIIKNIVSSGEIELIENLVKAGFNITLPLNEGTLESCLHIAAGKKNKAMVPKLVQLGASVNARKRSGATPLLIAAFNGRLENVETLIAAGADLNAVGEILCYEFGGISVNPEEFTPLTAAVYSGNVEIALRIVEAGAELNNPQFPAIYSGIHLNSTELLLAMIQRGASVNPSYSSYFSPLYTAAISGHFEIVKLLFKHGALLKAGEDVNTERIKNEEIRKFLLKNCI